MVNVSVDSDWSLPKIKEFIETLLTATLCTDIQELKNHTINECIWRKMEMDMKIDQNLLKNFWNQQLHMQLFCPEPIYLNDVKIKFIEYLHDKGIAAKKDIKWQNVLSHFDGYTHSFLYKTFGNLVRLSQLKTGATDLADTIQHLYNHWLPKIIDSVDDRILPRLIYQNGNVKHIDIDVEEWKVLHSLGSDDLSDSSSSEEE